MWLFFVDLFVFSHEGTDSPANSDDVIVVMDSFKAKIVKVKVRTMKTIFETLLLLVIHYTYFVIFSEIESNYELWIWLIHFIKVQFEKKSEMQYAGLFNYTFSEQKSWPFLC